MVVDMTDHNQSWADLLEDMVFEGHFGTNFTVEHILARAVELEPVALANLSSVEVIYMLQEWIEDGLLRYRDGVYHLRTRTQETEIKS